MGIGTYRQAVTVGAGAAACPVFASLTFMCFTNLMGGLMNCLSGCSTLPISPTVVIPSTTTRHMVTMTTTTMTTTTMTTTTMTTTTMTTATMTTVPDMAAVNIPSKRMIKVDNISPQQRLRRFKFFDKFSDKKLDFSERSSPLGPISTEGEFLRVSRKRKTSFWGRQGLFWDAGNTTEAHQYLSCLASITSCVTNTLASAVCTGLMGGATAAGCANIYSQLFPNSNEEVPQQDADEEQQQTTADGGKSNKIASITSIPIPIPGPDQQPDGCSREQVRNSTGDCVPLLSQGQGGCSNAEWNIYDPVLAIGRCAKIPCPAGMVLVVLEQLCYDVRDPRLCREGESVFLTSQGFPICSCQDGAIPFDGECSLLFRQGPCAPFQVLTVTQSLMPACELSRCPPIQNVPLLGVCTKFGAQGPCPDAQIVGLRQLSTPVCLNESQIYVSLGRQPSIQQRLQVPSQDIGAGFKGPFSKYQIAKQDLIGSLIQVPLLLSCFPGAKRDFNYKCRENIISRKVTSDEDFDDPAEPLFSCPSGFLLSEQGECQSPSRIKTCPEGFVQFRSECRFSTSSLG